MKEPPTVPAASVDTRPIPATAARYALADVLRNDAAERGEYSYLFWPLAA